MIKKIVFTFLILLLCSCSDKGIERLPESGVGTIYKIGMDTEGNEVYLRRITIDGEFVFLQCDAMGNFIRGNSMTLNSCESAAKKAAKETVENLLDIVSDLE